MKTLTNKQPKRKDLFLLIIRILASLLAIFFILAYVPKLVGEVLDVFKGEPIYKGWEGLVMETTFFVFLAGYVISWWRKCWGGLIIVLASLIQMGPFLIIQGNLGSLIFGVPLFVVGALFLILCLRAPQ
jgi:hypothetical protein